MNKNPAQAINKFQEYFTKVEAAEYLRISSRSLEKIPPQQLPRFRPGGKAGKAYYRKVDLDRWIERHREEGRDLNEIIRRALADLRNKKASANP